MCDDTFVCGEGSSTTSAFGECLKATGCAMDYEMRTYLSETSAAKTFMHPMIPHHRNAVNMAKALLRDGSLTSCEQSSDDGNADCGIEIMLRDLINTQNHQINMMEAWLSYGGYSAVEGALCDMQHGISSAHPNHMVMVTMGAILCGAVLFVLLAHAKQKFCQSQGPPNLALKKITNLCKNHTETDGISSTPNNNKTNGKITPPGAPACRLSKSILRFFSGPKPPPSWPPVIPPLH
eukprot:FR742842.1.p1 GENE.FR742842.1~~FR742842.1.p1  ORF type:complete len:236 (+),score=29.14 FR742842.1:292-999(+)